MLPGEMMLFTPQTHKMVMCKGDVTVGDPVMVFGCVHVFIVQLVQLSLIGKFLGRQQMMPPLGVFDAVSVKAGPHDDHCARGFGVHDLVQYA